MRLYSPVDLTGNVNMIEKLVLGGTGNRGPPDPQPDALTSAPSSHRTVLWNSLAPELKNSNISLVTFKSLLKTELFKKAYPVV